MSGVSKAISEELYKNATQALSLVSRSGDVSRKLQAIKSAKEHSVSIVATIFGVSRVAIMSWIKSFERKGIEGLQIQKGRGRKAILSDLERCKISKWVEANPNITINAIRAKAKEELNKSISVGAIHKLLETLNLSYITPRPIHYKQNQSLAEEFKKKSKLKSDH